MENNNIRERGTGQERVYNFIVGYITQNGFAPSMKEIADGTFINSTSSVHGYLIMLKMMGKIDMKENTPRAIRLIGYDIVKAEEIV